MKFCINCKTEMNMHIQEWCFRCSRCSLLTSTLKGEFQNSNEELVEAREAGLKHLRTKNFQKILKELSKINPIQDKSIIDIGCAQGWFVEEALKCKMKAFGIEAEPSVAEAGIKKGLPILVGFFPNDLPPEQNFDYIIFNDVFEHLPDPMQMLDVCYQKLNQGGCLVLNLPSSQGFFYRLASLMAVFKMTGAFKRLWQFDFYTPHLFYFNEKNLTEIIIQKNFKKISTHRLDTIAVNGLWARLGMAAEKTPLLKKLFLFFAVAVAAPLINFILPADTLVVIAKKEVMR